MNTKKAIKFMKDVINLLQRGEKYETILKELEYELDWHKPEKPLFSAQLEICKDEEHLNEILDMIAAIKKKHFPKGEE